MMDAGQGFRTTLHEQIGTVTSWPCAIALGATWDTALARRYGAALGREFRAKGANVILGPGLNVHRVARNGRSGEYLTGEEPEIGQASGRVAGRQGGRVAGYLTGEEPEIGQASGRVAGWQAYVAAA